MDTNQLRYFIMTAEMEHLTHAAEELNISPSALSSSISRLETELGVKLFNHVGRNILLNENGRIFIEYAKNIVSEAEAGQKAIDDFVNDKDRKVTIQSMPIPMYPALCERILNINPNIYFSGHVPTLKEVEEKLLTNEIDIFFNARELVAKGIKRKVLESDALCVLLSEKHPFASKEILTKEDLENMDYLLVEKAELITQQLEMVAEAYDFKPNVTMWFSTLYDLFSLMKVSQGVLVAGEKFYDRTKSSELTKGIKCIPLDRKEPILIERSLYYNKDNNRPQVKQIIKCIETYFKENNGEIEK